MSSTRISALNAVDTLAAQVGMPLSGSTVFQFGQEKNAQSFHDNDKDKKKVATVWDEKATDDSAGLEDRNENVPPMSWQQRRAMLNEQLNLKPLTKKEGQTVQRSTDEQQTGEHDNTHPLVPRRPVKRSNLVKPDEYMYRRDKEAARQSRLSSAELLESLVPLKKKATQSIEDALPEPDDDVPSLFRTSSRQDDIDEGANGSKSSARTKSLKGSKPKTRPRTGTTSTIPDPAFSSGRPPPSDGLSFEDRYKMRRRDRSGAQSEGSGVAAEVRRGESDFTISTNF